MQAVRDLALGEDALDETIAVSLDGGRDARDVGGVDAEADDGGHTFMILPVPDESFEWRDTPFGPVLVCQPLEEAAPHLFTTRAWALGARDASVDAWADIASAMGVPAHALARLTQVHGRATVVVDGRGRSVGTPPFPEADIALTGEQGLAIAVRAADCVPLLLADRRTGVVAAAHAGWRGLAQGVPRAAVDSLVGRFGSHPDDLVAAIGPSVGACCYEVGAEVRQAFVEAGFLPAALGRWFSDAPTPMPSNPSMPELPSEQRAGCWYFDGWASAREQLVAAGLADARIFTARLCTASHSDVLCSYRHDGQNAGRIAAAITPPRGR